MSQVTSHVLDTAAGRPAAGMHVELALLRPEGWEDVAKAVSDADGRVREWEPATEPGPGTWRLRFQVGEWLAGRGGEGFHPWVDVVFRVTEADDHCHVPLLLSPFGYTTYRGS